jgi:hypothetical protein
MSVVEQKPGVLETVEAGALYLDDVAGHGWWDCIDLETLHMGETTNCVLGQLYGTYQRGLAEIYGPNVDDDGNVDDDLSVEHGFTQAEYPYCGSWAPLTDAWSLVVRDRRAGW